MNRPRPANSGVPFLLAGLLFLSWLGYTVYGLALRYSYRYDELFSIVAASQPLRTQLSVYLNDVHPPLYQILLSAWVTLFGTGEAAARTLPALSLLAALPAFLHAAGRLSVPFVTLTFVMLFSNLNLYWFGQDARSYAVLLALSIWATILFATDERRVIFPILIAVSLTHFFGALLATAICLWMLAEHRRSAATVAASLLTIAAAASWPVIYLTLGGGSGVVGGNFWIDTTPGGSLLNALTAGAPIAIVSLDRLSGLLSADRRVFLALLVLAVLLLLAALRAARASAPPAQRVAILKALWIVAGTTAAAALISLHTPISTLRNHVIIIPAASMLLAAALLGLAQRATGLGRTVSTLVIVSYAGLSSLQVADAMRERFGPSQDWKTVAREVSARVAAEPEVRVFAYTPGQPRDPEFSRRVISHYFGEEVPTDLITLAEFDRLPERSIVFFGQENTWSLTDDGCENALMAELDRLGRSFTAHFMVQSWTCQNGYLVLGAEGQSPEPAPEGETPLRPASAP